MNLRNLLSTTQAIVTILATVAAPIIVAVIGSEYNDSLKVRDARLRTTELAIAVLQEDPKNAPETPRLREWAVNVVDAYSGVPFPDAARKELQENKLVAQAQEMPFRERLERHITDLVYALAERPAMQERKDALSCANLVDPDAETKYASRLDLETSNLLHDLILACRHFHNAAW